MSWSGSITVNVNNQTGGDITGLQVTHTWVTDGDKSTYIPNQPVPLAAGATVAFTANTGNGSDDWSVTFIDVNGICWARKRKQCDIEQKDVTSGSPINFNLLNGNQGFSIEMPLSSSCNDNSLGKCGS